MTESLSVNELIARQAEARFGLLDLLPEGDLAEKLIALALSGPPPAPPGMATELACLTAALNATQTKDVRVVVFGGGTGLSNLIGGDSRNPLWPADPFQGLKEVFPQTRAVVCVTDDGGSTGELLKDLPLIALGDLRHVLLSSIRQAQLHQQYDLDEQEALLACREIHALFNHRFTARPASSRDLLRDAGVDLALLPQGMGQGLSHLLEALFSEPRLNLQLDRSHCLGNLLLAASILIRHDEVAGISRLAELIGANPEAVFPCTTTPARLKVLYANGVLVSGEFKSGQVRRGYPVDRVFVEYAAAPQAPPQVLAAIAEADIILFAPGSLFTSIVPILQVPGIAQAIRDNRWALKMLVANLWIQAGETDMAHDDQQKRFHVSDLLAAYHRNIPGGMEGLFAQILVLGLGDIPGSILQSYALENKVPIYLDRDKVRKMGFAPVEARLYDQADMEQRRVIQHDPASLAAAVRVMWAIRESLGKTEAKRLPGSGGGVEVLLDPHGQTASQRFGAIRKRLHALAIAPELQPVLAEIFWRHGDIPLSHLDGVAGIVLLDREEWGRNLAWDTILSFYDPRDRMIKIRKDILGEPEQFEVGLLIALGQSLLGNYAKEKRRLPVEREGESLGYEFRLRLRPETELRSFFSPEELAQFLGLVRMRQSTSDPNLYTRLVNGDEGFTPPGLLFGLTYAWYLDNRHVCHIEYKMSIDRMTSCGLIPEQKRIAGRRQAMIDFFRTVVFRYNAPQLQPSAAHALG
ncbi:gluconeogenesis factor YvcK family protein [Thiovibrio frasassiensis]|uniref:YvcK family protein n=1 Tax=Thiovibrio frasassiensis TaxID=2984131 RepID=A0A9X4ME73_9BACT|nr:gluconeogenesis factor YvcK family protein [Thiovibrio frasassiensis]MDG4474663.1 YvcK family protein [Thiovibrio frasassiensis]